MWQITWMLGFLPSWFWTTVLLFSIIGLLLAWLFTKLPYSLPVKVFSILGIVLSVWALGAAANEEKWQARIKELETQLAAAQAASTGVTKEVEVKVVEKTKFIKGKSQEIIKYIDRWNTKEVVVEGPERIKREEIIKYIEMCPVPKEIIDAHNAAAEMNKAAEGAKK
jgi:hypothetical protein